MRISAEDMKRVLNPELNDPELERRRLDTIARAKQMFGGKITPERLRDGIPVYGLKLPKKLKAP